MRKDGERIVRLADLRTWAEHYPHHEIPGGEASVLALVKAVEAARELNRVQTAETSTGTEWANARQRLLIALARFDFDDVAP